jgi:ABC-2 type transport system ATP-binding protein
MTIELRELTIRYGSVLAVDRATARFPAGAVGLLGRNGAGKTSVLKAILGLVRPTSGTIQVLDLPVGAGLRELRRRIGYMPEKDCWVAGLNGYETVKLAGELSGLPGGVAARRAHEVLYVVGLEEQRYRPVAGYSTGMRQRVKLAAALVHDPALLFLDEPTNGLDPQGRKDLLGVIRMLANDFRKSVVLSTHILQDVESVCASIVLLDGGRVLRAGTLVELTRAPARLLRITVTGEAARAADALRAAGALQVEAHGPELRVVVPETLARAQLFAALAAAGANVQRLVEHRRTLEEVFLGALEPAPAGAR